MLTLKNKSIRPAFAEHAKGVTDIKSEGLGQISDTHVAYRLFIPQYIRQNVPTNLYKCSELSSVKLLYKMLRLKECPPLYKYTGLDHSIGKCLLKVHKQECLSKNYKQMAVDKTLRSAGPGKQAGKVVILYEVGGG